jgi:phospholipid/cholesterol/gamma-HCH transport system substrate-binding protein
MNNKHAVIVGIFILLGITILIVTIFTLGGQKKTFIKSFNIHAVFNDIGGLIKGGNVWFSGVKVGTVKRIGFFGNSQVEVTMSIQNDLQSRIHKDAKARIGSDGLIGNRIVIIYGGDPATPQIEKNGSLKVETALSTDDMMATLQANNKNLLEITKNFKSISKKIDNGKGMLATLLNDPAMATKLNITIDQLQTTVENFKEVSETGKNMLSNLNSFSGKLNQQGNSIYDLISDTVIYSNIKGSLAELENAATAVAAFTTNLKSAGEQLNSKTNIAGVLLNDSTSANNIKSTLKNLETSSHKLDEDLEAVQHNFLLRGFFRKKEKLKRQ